MTVFPEFLAPRATIPSKRLRKWLVDNYPLSSTAASTFIEKHPKWAIRLAHLLPPRARFRLLADRELGMLVLKRHPGLFSAHAIRQFVARHSLAVEQLPLPVRRIIGAPPFTDAVHFGVSEVVEDVTAAYFWYVQNRSPICVRGTPYLFASTRRLRIASDDEEAVYLINTNFMRMVTDIDMRRLYNSVVDIAPSLPACLITHWAERLSQYTKLSRRLRLKYVFTAGRLPPPGYCIYVTHLLARMATPRQMFYALAYEMRGLQLPRFVLVEAAARYMDTRLISALCEQHLLRIPRSVIMQAKRVRVCHMIEKV